MLIDIILFVLIILLFMFTIFRFTKFGVSDIIAFGIILGCQVMQLLDKNRTVFDFINTILILILFIIVSMKTRKK